MRHYGTQLAMQHSNHFTVSMLH